MNKLIVTLKQHTPLIHFQPNQEGATLRASEVKPKLDRYILTKLGNDDYQSGINLARDNGWLIGTGQHASLNYKMKIVASNPINLKMGIQPKKDKIKNQKKDELGELLYITENYPDNSNSLIMGNMEGRTKSDLLNFKMYESTILDIITTATNMDTLLREHICDFFAETNFGNRTSKGFGSYTVFSINGIMAPKERGDWSLLFYLKSDGKDIDNQKAYKDIFFVINKLWKALKKFSEAPTNSKLSVLLGRNNSLSDNEDRIPSALIFKPIIINKEKNLWEVKLLAFLNHEIIDAAEADPEDFYNLIDNAVDVVKATSKNTHLEDIKNNYQIEFIRIS